MERRQAYESTADDSEAAGGSTQSELSLKPGETITLKLAKVSRTFQSADHPTHCSSVCGMHLETIAIANACHVYARPLLNPIRGMLTYHE